MRNFFLVCALAFSISVGAADELRRVYVSTGDGLIAYAVGDGGGLTEIDREAGRGLTAIAADSKRLYRVGAKAAETFEIDAEGKLELLHTDPGTAPASYLMLDRTERYLAGSNYGGGSVAIWKIDQDRNVQGQFAAQVPLEKAAHSSVFSKNNRWLLVPATTPNKVFQLAFDDASGSLTPHSPLAADGPPVEAGNATQPRHLVFHPDLPIAYTTLEREMPGVGVWSWDEESGELRVIQNVVTYPENFEGSITTADLHLTPDSRFLYVSNRDLTDRKAMTGDSSIVGFSVDSETGKLTLLGHTPCPQIPRSFAIDEAGDYLYSAGQVTGTLEVYEIDRETGALASQGEIETGKGPNWVKCVTLNPEG
ncbi:MAG: beta-propeller fold lactonase family protein [Verrucomicrobiota bacterium]